MRPLQVGRGVNWPAAIASQAIGVLGMRGAGKSNFGRVMAEELFASKIPFVVFDPIGNWYGIRAGGDARPGGGVPIPIFGGQHHDLPLDRTSGTKIADLVIDRGLSCVLDLSHEDFSESDKQRFLAEFGDRLFRRKTRESGWLTLLMEEADDYAPQPRSGGGVKGEAAKTLGMFQRLVRRGRFNRAETTAVGLLVPEGLDPLDHALRAPSGRRGRLSVKQLPLEGLRPPPAPPPLRFNGEAYDPRVDQPRLARQHEKLRDFLLDRPGRWFTLDELAGALEEPPASLSAQLRHLRKKRFGAWHTPKRRRGDPARGLYEYSILPADVPCSLNCPPRCGQGRDHHGGA